MYRIAIGLRILAFLSIGAITNLVLAQEVRQEKVVIAAMHKDGKPATIDKDKLRLLIDDVPVEIEDVTPAKDQNSAFAVLLDSSGSMRDKVAFSRDAAHNIFKALAANDHKGYFGLFGDGILLTSAPVAVDQIDRLTSRVVPSGGATLADAVNLVCGKALSRESNPENSRRILVLVTDGDDRASDAETSRSIETAQTQGVSVVVLGLVGNGFQNVKKAKEKMKLFASETGGSLVLMDGPGDYMKRLMPFFNSQYVLTFRNSAHKDEKLHAVEVSSSIKEIQVAAPRKIAFR